MQAERRASALPVPGRASRFIAAEFGSLFGKVSRRVT